MEETIDLKEYFAIIKRNFKMIVSTTLIVGAIGCGLGLLSKPAPVQELVRDYQSTSRVLISYDINQLIEKLNSLENEEYIKGEIEKAINNNYGMLKTYSELINSNKSVEKVISNLDLAESITSIRKNITVTPVEGGQIINIDVKNNNPKVAADIANELAKVFKEENKDLDISIEDKAIASDTPMPLLDASGKELPEPTPPVPHNPMKKAIINGAIGIVLGGMMSLFVVFLKEYIDNKVRNVEQIENIIGIDVLGVVQKEGK